MPDPIKKKKLEVQSKDDPRYKAYQDSLSLYKNYQDVTKALNKQEYTSKTGGTFEAALQNAKARTKKIKNNDPEIRKEINSLYSITDFVPGQINRTLPRQLFSETIKPIGMKSYRAPSYFFSEDPIPGRPHDARSVADYSNVNPKQEVIISKPIANKKINKANSTNSGYTLQNDGTKFYQDYIPKGMMTKEVVSSTGDRSVEFVPQLTEKRAKEQSITPLNVKGLNYQQGIDTPNISLRTESAYIPDSYTVKDTINQTFGGRDSTYQVTNPNNLQDLGPGNTRTVMPNAPYWALPHDLGGYIQQDKLSPTLNNYLNSNMNQYKNGGMLNRYDVGGTHEQNEHGGIPIGKDSSVEQGEASVNLDQEGNAVAKPTGKKYIYSDRQLWTADDVKAAGLPPMRKGAMTASEYMKKLDDKFKGREGSKDVVNTMQAFQKRAQGLAEQKRMQEEQLNAAMMANSQQNQQVQPQEGMSDVPQGMEEYAEQPPQMFMGGNFSASEAGNLTGGASGIASTMPNARVNFAGGGMFGLPWEQYSSSSTGQPLNAAGSAIPGMENQIIPTSGNFAGNVMGAAGAATTAFDLYGASRGNTTRNMGMSIAGNAAKGALAGAAFGPWGAAVGGVAGGIAGGFGAKKAEKQYQKELDSSITSANAGMPNASAWSAMGGYITSKPAKYAEGGIHIDPANRGKFNATKERTGKTTEELTHSDNPLTRKRAIFAQNAAKWHHAYGGYEGEDPVFGFKPTNTIPQVGSAGINTNIPLISNIVKPNDNTYFAGEADLAMARDKANASNPSINKYLDYFKNASNKAGQYLNDNSANMMRAYPVLSNIIQRDAITNPTGTMYARLNDTFNVPEVDEAAGMRDINQLYGNQRRAIGQMGGSQAQQRAALMGIGSQETEAVSKYATQAAQQNQALALQKQQYKNSIAQYNAGAQDRSTEAYRADLGNYDTQKSKFTGQIGSDIGDIGTEQLRMKQVASMYGYSWDGKYMRDPKTGSIVTPPTEKATVAYGGYIKRKPAKY